MAKPIGKDAAAFNVVGVSTGGGGGGGVEELTGSFLHEAMANKVKRQRAGSADFISKLEPFLYEPLKL